MKQRKRNNLGFTMAELLIVVAIIIVLSGVAFLAVQRYHRGMAQLERDSIAKEIFVAAQNHLTQANSQGYPGVTEFGYRNGEIDNEKDNIYYYVIPDSSKSFTTDGTSAIDQMLPFGAIEEHTRAHGSYIIRYQSNPATVLDVFYCPPEGQYAHQLADEDYDEAMGLKDKIDDETGKVTKNNREARRNVSDWDGAVIGWYGGAESLQTGAEINAPDIRVENGDRLIVKVYDTNIDKRGMLEGGTEDVSLKLIVTGVTSGAKIAIPLVSVPGTPINTRYDTPVERYEHDGEYTVETNENKVNEYTVVLDDITTTATSELGIVDKRFAALNSLTYYMNGKEFLPGENIVISAVAFSNKALTNVAYSREYTTNSLFADMEPDDETEDATDNKVYVDSIRHLENLDKKVSSLVNQSSEEVEDSENPYDIKKAVQTRDLDWGAFKTAIAPEDAESVRILYNDGGMTEAGCYKPVDIGYALTYDGMTTLTEAPADDDSEGEAPPEPVTTQVIHEIKNIRVDTAADAGVFGSVSEIGTIKNLKIVDCDIASTGEDSSAGALAGELNGVDVLNVTAYGKSTFKDAEGNDVTRNVTAKGSAGGLVGKLTAQTVGADDKVMTYGSVDNCAAALYVSGGKDAGGLVGSITGAVQVKASYSGGHTDHGCYYVVEEKDGAVSLKLEDGKPVPIVNVTGTANVGGLIGSAGDATVEKCYSTCSVKGAKAGGLAGSAGGTIKDSYCTGLVVGKDEDAVVGAFAGKLDGTATDCLFFGIINDDLPAVGEGSASGISELDADTKSYNDFVGGPDSWNDAKPYDDEKLTQYYGDSEGKPRFNLRTVDQIDQETKKKSEKVHYGDWPAPEIFVTNEAE